MTDSKTTTITVEVNKDHLKGMVGELIYETLFRYSEWLDGQGLVVDLSSSDDKRPHDELVRDFLTED